MARKLFTTDEVKKIRLEYDQTYVTLGALSDKYQCSQSCIRQIIKGDSYGHIKFGLTHWNILKD